MEWLLSVEDIKRWTWLLDYGPMICKSSIHAFKTEHSGSFFFKVTIELQYANEIDNVSSKSF